MVIFFPLLCLVSIVNIFFVPARVSESSKKLAKQNNNDVDILSDDCDDIDETPHVPNLYKPRKSIFDRLDINLDIIEETDESKRMSLLTNQN